MNKAELVDAIAKETGLTKKDAAAALNAFTGTVSKELKKGGSVQLIGFGTFEVGKRAARTGRNPQTGEAIKIKAAKTPKFKAGKACSFVSLAASIWTWLPVSIDSLFPVKPSSVSLLPFFPAARERTRR